MHESSEERSGSRAATQVRRQWRLLRLLGSAPQGLGVADLAAELDVAIKTVRRDLATLRRADFPLTEHAERHGRKRWRIAAETVPVPRLRTDEIVALHLARRFLTPLAGTFFWQSLTEAFDKLQGLCPAAIASYAAGLDGVLHLTRRGHGDYRTQAEIVDELFRAAEERLQTVMLYRSRKATEPVEYEIHPLRLTWHHGSLYLDAWSADHGHVRTFKVDRVQSVEVGRLSFTPPEDFDADGYAAGSFGVWHGDDPIEVVVRFAPAAVRHVRESFWHESMTTRALPDGGLLATLRLTATAEVRAWVLSFGPRATVVSPPELVEGILADLHAMTANHRHAADAESRR